jgi:antitoxin ParD1/3/4
MNVQLSPELEEIVAQKLESGRYRSAEELIEAALELIDARDEILDLDHPELTMKIEEGLESLRTDEAIDGEGFFDEMELRLKTLSRQSKSN